MTYLFYNWKFDRFDPFHPVHPVHPTPHPQPLATTNLIPPSLLTCHSGTVLRIAQAVEQEPCLFLSWEARQSRSLGGSEKFAQLTTLSHKRQCPQRFPSTKAATQRAPGQLEGAKAQGRSAGTCLGAPTRPSLTFLPLSSAPFLSNADLAFRKPPF